MKSVTFFGASVTEQSAHHATNEMTGFVSYFEKHMAEDMGIEVSRVSAGSSDISDAALVYVETVLEIAPDICVMDWVTPVLMDCDIRFVEQIYYRLLCAGIWPVTLFLPRRDRVQSQIPLAKKMVEVAGRFNLPVHDLGLEFSAQDLMGPILRDVVHTTAEGAKRYAELVADILEHTEIGPFSDILPPPPFYVSRLPVVEGQERTSCKRIIVTADEAASEPTEFVLVQEQRVGPYSPIADVTWGTDAETKETGQISIWDPWCHRERQCLKKITPWQTGIFDRVEINISQTPPNYAVNPACSHVPYAERFLRPRGALFLVSTKPQHGVVRYK